jgi:hypothetical protein
MNFLSKEDKQKKYFTNIQENSNDDEYKSSSITERQEKKPSIIRKILETISVGKYSTKFYYKG